MKINSFYILLVFVAILMSCNDDDPIIENPEELITTVNYYLTPVDGGDMLTLTFQDLDGDGGNSPVIKVDSLAANTTYNATLELLNESVDPLEDITVEIKAEDENHQFFFDVSGASLSVSYDDADSNGNPVGLATVVTAVSGSGTLTITLKHEPKKDAAGVSDGDITNAEGETDIEVLFPIIIL